MKIALFCYPLCNSGGIERMTASLANYLIDKNILVDIIVCHSSIESFYSIDSRINIYKLNEDFKKRLQSAIALRKIICSNRYDIFINVAIPMGQISFITYLTIRKHPILISWEHFHLYAGSKIGYLFRLLSCVLCKRTIVLTDQDKSKYPKFLQKKIQRIYNFTIDHFEEYNSYTIKKENIVLSVGRLENQKGFDLLLPIWKKVQDKINGWKLYIIGNGSMKEYLQNKITQMNINNTVEILPATPRIIDYYKISSIYVMTSRYEGLPMVLLEARSFGIPTISFDCPNGPSEIIHDGKDGYVVPMNNEELFSNRLTELIKNKEKRLTFSDNSYKDTCCRFSSQSIIKQWLNLFDELLK